MPGSSGGASSLKFGTSGLRGLVVDLEGQPARQWVRAFLRHCGVRSGPVLVGRDLRASSSGIAADCAAAIAASGLEPTDCGALPTPALALESERLGVPAIMVTGSHIPEDRNGLKFYRAGAEITKGDEDAIRAAWTGETVGDMETPIRDGAREATTRYRRRYLDFFASDALAGLAVGIYQHSSVARDLLVEVVEALGARAIPLARSEIFVPVDTEAHGPDDFERMRAFAALEKLDAIVSTDGDADRPLVADETGQIVRGDILGMLTARRFGLSTIVTPVTSGSAMERFGATVLRTRVGSPYVIAGMAEAGPAGGLVGFEANGGVLLGSAVTEDGRTLRALPTRDALLPILACLSELKRSGQGLGALVAALEPGHVLADRLKDVPASASATFLESLAKPTGAQSFFAPVGAVAAIDTLDGTRVRLGDGAVVHFRASGNSPELRCYVEAGDARRAADLLAWGIATAGAAIRGL